MPGSRTDQIAARKEAINTARQAVESTQLLNDLATNLETRYRRLGQMADLARLADEVIYVVSVFRWLAFLVLLATFYMDVAGRFYSSIVKDRTGFIKIAAALREAVLKVGETDMDIPLEWAPFVHFSI